MALTYIVVILVCITSVLVGAQEPCICTTQADIDTVENIQLTIETLIARLQDISTLEARLQNVEKLQNVENLIKPLQIQLNEITSAPTCKTSGEQRTTYNSVSTYTQWGKKTCTLNGTRTLYNGYAAGGHYTHGGRSPSMLCLPRDPEWAKYDDKLDKYGGMVYGVEYEHIIKRANALLGKSVQNLEAPCAVCESDRSAHIMIPGRITCYPGWTREYGGYLMTGHFDHPSQADYYCVDSKPEVLDGGSSDKNGYLLYFFEVRCESLRCPPYVKGRELPCVVCTK